MLGTGCTPQDMFGMVESFKGGTAPKRCCSATIASRKTSTSRLPSHASSLRVSLVSKPCTPRSSKRHASWCNSPCRRTAQVVAVDVHRAAAQQLWSHPYLLPPCALLRATCRPSYDRDILPSTKPPRPPARASSSHCIETLPRWRTWILPCPGARHGSDRRDSRGRRLHARGWTRARRGHRGIGQDAHDRVRKPQ